MNLLKRFHILLICVLPTLEAKPLSPGKSELLFLDNGTVKIGIDRAMGASITWLSWSDYPSNMVNIHDPGRLIQQSYYAGLTLDRRKDGQHKSWSPWTWNPIQGGGVGSWARVTRFEKKDNGLFAETIPKLWDMHDEEAEATMQQWMAFEPEMPNVVVIRNRLICKRSEDDRWGPPRERHQEVPACYFTRNFDQFKSYLGGGKWRSEEQPPGPPWGKTKPPLKAMACLNKDGHGIAIFSPVSGDTWNFGPHAAAASKAPKGGPCVHLAPLTTVALGPKSTFEYRYWLLTGSAKELAEGLDRLITKYDSEEAKLSK